MVGCRITDGLNRYAHGNVGKNSNSPWSKIPVRNSSSGSVSLQSKKCSLLRHTLSLLSNKSN